MTKDLVKKKCICCAGTGFVWGKKRVAVTQEQKKKIIQLYKKGKGIREIQRELKIEHPYSVSYAIKTAHDNEKFLTTKNI